MKYVYATGLVVLGFAAGWVTRSNVFPDVPEESLGFGINVSSNTIESPDDRRFDQEFVIPIGQSPSQISNKENAPIEFADTSEPSATFSQLLERGEYVAALEFYQQRYEQDRSAAAPLKTTLMSHLESRMSVEFQGAFMELTDLYLTQFYDDVDVLLLLAKFNKQTNFFVEAIGVYHLAAEYAYTLQQRENVDSEFDSFIREVHEYLRSIDDWYALSQVYLQADIVGMLKPQHKLMQAAVYLNNGDIYLAKEVLQALVQTGDAQLVDRANDMLASVNQENTTTDDRQQASYTETIDLQTHGNQYLVDLLLGDNATRLLIDTGASITTLSGSAFEGIRSSLDLEELGVRMFSTANGVTKGRLFRVYGVGLGNIEINDTMIAVLDFEMSHGIQGLLGMNILGNYRFEIDQKRKKLLLTPRSSQ